MLKCERCGTTNSDTDTFCRSCGTRLAAPAAVVPVVAPPRPGVSTCPACGMTSPPGSNFCLSCGGRLSPAMPAPAPMPASAVMPAPMPRPAPMPAPEPPPARPAPAVPPMNLVNVRRDGTDGAVFSFVGEQVDIGRTEGDLLFDDPHLAARHARVTWAGSDFVMTPLEQRNGVFVRLRVPMDLSDGDIVLIGKQVLRFELVPEGERTLRPALEHGLVVFGSPVAPSWGRLRQITSSGVTRDVYHLSRPDAVLGRTEGDIVFSDDEFMSRRHVQLSLRGNRIRIEDLGSSNGTFLKIRDQHVLVRGDLIRLGDELLRFELG